MASKSKPTSRPWTALAVILGVLVLLYASLFATSTTSPKLGLDLQGGTTVTLRPTTPAGAPKPTSGQINKAVDIIRARVNGLGVAEAEVVKQGQFIIISVPGKNSGQVVSLVGQTAKLTFREVLTEAAALPQPAPSASVHPSGSPAPSTSGNPTATLTPKPSASAKKRAISSALLAAPSPSATTKATTAIIPTPTPSSPATTTTSTTQPPANVIKLFTSTLPCSVYRDATVAAQDSDWVVSCDRDGHYKYLLKPARVVGTDVKGASAVIQQAGSVITGQWEVLLSFTGGGQKKFTKLTEELSPTKKQLAVVLDGEVQSAPAIQTVISGDASITGNFTQRQANDLANVLKYGALPLTFEKSQIQSVSATLGRDSLRAGLIAGAIGLALVILYCFLYYRAMGIVTVVSLAVSGLLVFGMVCALGKMIGFTLTLAGIAGLIVSIGITADSFVVFYERLKDEVREGRTPRSSVDRGWVRARRTILSADTVSFLAAVVLYLLSVGSVKGFAFTLGLSTLLDVVVVFLFTKPLVSILVKKNFFSSSRWSGLTSVARSGAESRRATGTASATVSTKEA